MSAPNSNNNQASMIGGHAQYAKGYVEESVGMLHLQLQRKTSQRRKRRILEYVATELSEVPTKVSTITIKIRKRKSNLLHKLQLPSFPVCDMSVCLPVCHVHPLPLPL